MNLLDKDLKKIFGGFVSKYNPLDSTEETCVTQQYDSASGKGPFQKEWVTGDANGPYEYPKCESTHIND